jgi:Zn-dependent M28 family amino/carboxypeptidase
MFESVSEPVGPNWKLRFTCAALILGLIAGSVWFLRMTQMPLKSYAGTLPPLSPQQADLESRLRENVKDLSVTIGERNAGRPGSLQSSVDYLRSRLRQSGYTVIEYAYSLGGRDVKNLEASLVGTEPANGVIVVGAHYDSAQGTAGANDNATGVAAVLELARAFQGRGLRRQVRFVFFVNEEPPYFQTNLMGSLVYARRLERDHVPVSAMLSLETIGFYSDVHGSQKYPALLNLFYPDRGNFVGVVGNPESRDLVRQVVRKFRESTDFPSEGLAAPADWPGIGWSDQWSFWQQGYSAIMITDTAAFRYPYYHSPLDTPEKVDFGKMARVVDGVRGVIESLANQ